MEYSIYSYDKGVSKRFSDVTPTSTTAFKRLRVMKTTEIDKNLQKNWLYNQ